MMYSGSSSSEPTFDWEFEEFLAQCLMNSSVDATTITSNYPIQPSTSTINGVTVLGGNSSNARHYPNQPFTSTINGGTVLGEGSSNAPHYPNQPFTSTINGGKVLEEGSSNAPHYPNLSFTSTINGGKVLGEGSSNAPYYPNKPFTSTINGGKVFGEGSSNEPYYPNKPFTSTINGGKVFGEGSSNAPYYPNKPFTSTINGGKVFGEGSSNAPYYSNKLFTSTINGGKVFGEGSSNVPHYPNQPFTSTINGGKIFGEGSSNAQNPNQHQLQLQQATGSSSSQNQLQLQQATRSSGNLISGGGRKQGNYINLNFSAPVGFATPNQFFSTKAYHAYVLREIRILKERYYNELLKMHYNARELHTRATNMDDSNKYGKVIAYLERMMAFLNISRVDSLPKNDQMIYNNMNTVVNYVSYHMNKPGYSSLHRDPAHQPPKGPQVQPVRATMLQNNPSPNPYQKVTNLEPNMPNFNHNFRSRIPNPQPPQSGLLPSSPSITPFQTAPHPSVVSTPQHINLGPMTKSVIRARSRSPISLFTNTPSTNFPSHSFNHQPPVANQNFNFEKMKAPMHKTNELPVSRARHGMSPLCSGLVNQCPSTLCSLPSTVNPTPQQTSISTPKVDVNSHVLSPHSTAGSPVLLSSSPSAPPKTPVDTPSQEPETSKDHAFHSNEVVKPVSSNALISSVTNISPIKKVKNLMPDYVSPNLVGTYIKDGKNVMLEYDHEQLQKRRRESSAPSVSSDQFVSQGCAICSRETSTNKRAKIEDKCAILEEIKEINNRLLETSMTIDPSDDDINILGAHEGTIVKCLFKNVCFLLGPNKGAPSEKMPEFVVLLLVPENYPASAPRIIKSSRDVLNNEPWGKLYDEMLNKFNLSLFGITGKPSLGDMARNWEASARAAVTEFLKKRSGKSSSERYGNWENCMNSSSSSN